MIKWLAEYWYAAWGIAAAAIYVWFRMSHNPAKGSAVHRLRAILRPGLTPTKQGAREAGSLQLREVCVVIFLLFVVLVVIPYFVWE